MPQNLKGFEMVLGLVEFFNKVRDSDAIALKPGLEFPELAKFFSILVKYSQALLIISHSMCAGLGLVVQLFSWTLRVCERYGQLYHGIQGSTMPILYSVKERPTRQCRQKQTPAEY